MCCEFGRGIFQPISRLKPMKFNSVFVASNHGDFARRTGRNASRETSEIAKLRLVQHHKFTSKTQYKPLDCNRISHR